MRGYDDSNTTFERPGFSEYAGPARAPTMSADVWPAITQGAFAGVVGGGIMAGGVGLLGGGVGAIALSWLGCAAVFSLGVWYVRQDVYDRTLHESQRRDTRPVVVNRIDAGEPGHVLLNPQAGRAQLARANADRGRAEFLAFVKGCENGPTTGRFWEPKIGRPKYQAWREELLRLGWAERDGDGPNAGWHLTAPAAEVAAAVEAGE